MLTLTEKKKSNAIFWLGCLPHFLKNCSHLCTWINLGCFSHAKCQPEGLIRIFHPIRWIFPFHGIAHLGNSTTENIHQMACKKSYKQGTVVECVSSRKESLEKAGSFQWLFERIPSVPIQVSRVKKHEKTLSKKARLNSFQDLSRWLFSSWILVVRSQVIIIKTPPNIWGPLTYIKGFCPLSVSKPQ